MSTTKESTSPQEKQEKLTRLRNSLKTSRALQETKLAMGVEGIDKYVLEVEGDWLETWDEENQE